MQQTIEPTTDAARFMFWLLNEPNPTDLFRDLPGAAQRCPLRLEDIEWPVVHALCGKSPVFGLDAKTSPPSGSAPVLTDVQPVYDNSSVIRQIVKRYGVQEAEAVQWFQEMLKFLAVMSALIEEDGDYWPKSPPPLIDAAWHEFILHTEDYADYCEKTFGRFIDHHPSATADGPAEKVNSAVHYTRVLLNAEERFGPLDREVWPALTVCADGRVLSTGQL